MKPRKFDAPKHIFPANFPIENLDFFFVVEPDGNIIKMYPVLHADPSERKILRSFVDKKTKTPHFTFSSWADEEGYLALDEVYKEEGREDDYKWFLKHDAHAIESRRSGKKTQIKPVPDEYLPQLVLDRRAGRTPELAPFKFPKKDKRKKATPANVEE